MKDYGNVQKGTSEIGRRIVIFFKNEEVLSEMLSCEIAVSRKAGSLLF